MPAPDPAFFGLFDDTRPDGLDSRTISDDTHRNIGRSLRIQGPNWTGAINATHEDINGVTGFAAGGVKPMPGQGGITVIYAYNTDTPPLGWTVEELDVSNVYQLVVGPAAGGGATGGDTDPTNLTQSAALTVTGNTGVTDINHTHGAGSLRAPRSVDPNVGGPTSGSTHASDAHDHDVTGDTGSGGGSHSHDGSTLSGTAAVQIAPRYARGILMKLAP